MPQKIIKSVAKTFEILELLAKNENGLSLTALSHTQNAPANTIKGLLNTLMELGYVSQPAARGPYCITSRVFLLTQNLTWEQSFRKTVPDLLEALQKASGGELAVASLVDGLQLLEIERLSCRHGLGVTSGGSFSIKSDLHRFAQGRIILSTLSETALNNYLQVLNLSQKEADILKNELKNIDPEKVLDLSKSWEEGIHSLAIGVYEGNRLRGTLAVNLPEFRCTAALLKKTKAALKKATENINHRCTQINTDKK